jgi:hypothetical protein
LSKPSSRFRRILGIVAIQIVVCLALLEIASQAYYFFVVENALDKFRHSEWFYYSKSPDPALAFELERGLKVSVPTRRLNVNQRGIREDSEESFGDKVRIGILGDSATFGTGLSQDATLPADLQRLLDPNVTSLKVFNFGLPGYGLEEMPIWLKRVTEQYRPNGILYLLNMNDFSRRDSIYEGADNGLYRIFKPPTLVLPFLVRKAIYRHHKGDSFSSLGWYRWLFDGNRDWALHKIVEMNRYAQDNKMRFAVAVLPAGIAYAGDGYRLAAEQTAIMDFLKQSNIATIDLTAALTAKSFDNTDHFNKAGAEEAAQALATPVRSLLLD